MKLETLLEQCENTIDTEKRTELISTYRRENPEFPCIYKEEKYVIIKGNNILFREELFDGDDWKEAFWNNVNIFGEDLRCIFPKTDGYDDFFIYEETNECCRKDEFCAKHDENLANYDETDIWPIEKMCANCGPVCEIHQYISTLNKKE